MIEKLLNDLATGLIETVFGGILPMLPGFNQELTDNFLSFIDFIISSVTGILPFFIHISTIKTVVSILLAFYVGRVIFKAILKLIPGL